MTRPLSCVLLLAATLAAAGCGVRARRTDRIAKYNQLLRIEEQLGSRAPYNGPKEVKGQG